MGLRDEVFEAIGLDVDFVFAAGQRKNLVVSLGVGCHIALFAGARVGHGHFRIRQNRAGLIAHRSDDCTKDVLRMRRDGKKAKAEHHNQKAAAHKSIHLH